jgi:hypothetical protein
MDWADLGKRCNTLVNVGYRFDGDDEEKRRTRKNILSGFSGKMSV